MNPRACAEAACAECNEHWNAEGAMLFLLRFAIRSGMERK